MHKVTTKRQVTLPQAVCQAMALQPGDYVEVFARDGVAYIVKMNSGNIAGKFNHLLKGNEFPSSEGMKKAIKIRAADKILANGNL
ncbi:AbrB/MazE/SpoVT family DNA-binding domain-containing protein [Methyloglobulus sp.]|uniref:AbrB/MazE/SpoVT family DNA-binding domain-containing protein n=1 Tax=Methyloglobulus sp. TaxID=2518622 RepID=UPI0039896948